ncbi:MAG: monovalent cation/H+ antiporter complex subunit F [Planctomycetota bacterium]
MTRLRLVIPTLLTLSTLVLCSAPAYAAKAAQAAQTVGENMPSHHDDRTALGQFIVDVAAPICVAVLLIAVCLCIYRMIRGPHLADRVLAGDTIAILVVGIVAVFSVMLESDLFFDAALVVAIIGFASTVAFSQYIGAKRKTDDTTTNTPPPETPA